MAQPDYGNLAELVGRWCAQAGVSADRLRLDDHGKPVVILRLFTDDMPRNGGTSSTKCPPDNPAGQDRARLSPIIKDILSTLEEVGKPLTTTRLMTAMAERGYEWSERWVSEWLAKMVDDGTLENPKGARPPGYRLPEWSCGESTSEK